MFGSKIKQVPHALLHALRRGLEKLKPEDLSAGQYRLRGRAVIEIDCWLRKGEPTTARLPVPKIQVLSLALERVCERYYSPQHVVPLLNRQDLAALINKAAFELTEGLEAKTPTVDAALDAAKDLMPAKDREGACVYTGQAKIVSFDES